MGFKFRIGPRITWLEQSINIGRMNTNSTILIKRSLIERVVLCNLNNAYFLIHVVFAYQKPVFNDFLGFNGLPVNIGFCEDKTQL